MKKLLTLCASACLALGACSEASPAAPSVAGTAGAGGAGGAPSEGEGDAPEVGARVCRDDAPPVAAIDLTGRWAYLEVQAQIVQAPGFAEPFRNLIVTAMLMDQVASGGAVAGTATVCHRHTAGALVQAEVPDRVVASITPFEYTAAYGADGSFAMEPVYLLLGYTATAPADRGALPTEVDDPSVFDQDGDGAPGVTIVLSGLVDGQVHTVQWARLAPTGAAIAEDRIEGLLAFEADENVLSSDPPAIALLSPESTPAPEPCWSTFQMVRVHASADCPWLTAELATLFPDVASTLSP